MPGQKALLDICSLVAALFRFRPGYGAPNFNALPPIWKVERNPDHLPWYSLTGLLFLRWVLLPSRRRKRRGADNLDSLCLLISVAAFSSRRYKICGVGRRLRLLIPAIRFRFAKDVIVNNNEVIEEQHRMAQLSK